MAKTETRYKVRLQGKLPFSRVAIPGISPSVVVSREYTDISKEEHDALQAALKNETIPGLTKDNVDVQTDRVKVEDEPKAE